MNTSAKNVETPRATKVWFSRGRLHVVLEDGREIACPVTMFPRLCAATAKDRVLWTFTGNGAGIHWPTLDEDLSVQALLDGSPMARPEPSILVARGECLQAARLAAGLTQAELAAALGKSQTLVSLAERGRTWTGEPYRLEVLMACERVKGKQGESRTGLGRKSQDQGSARSGSRRPK